MHFITKGLGFAPMAMFMVLPFCAPVAEAGNSARTGAQAGSYIDPRLIDRTVAEFTGANIGEVGGARVPADQRLRLAHCTQPLSAAWHGTSKSTVRVECPDAGGWRIFIATRPAPTAAAPQRVVKRGDPITVVVRGRGFTVQQSGEAMENGAIGDWIGVRVGKPGRNGRKPDPVSARIERPGLAVIPAS
ncbi:MAG: flagella basal body P-ring formation protein FlgA [Pseudomonadota bacterium]